MVSRGGRSPSKLHILPGSCRTVHKPTYHQALSSSSSSSAPKGPSDQIATKRAAAIHNLCPQVTWPSTRTAQVTSVAKFRYPTSYHACTASVGNEATIYGPKLPDHEYIAYLDMVDETMDNARKAKAASQMPTLEREPNPSPLCNHYTTRCFATFNTMMANVTTNNDDREHDGHVQHVTRRSAPWYTKQQTSKTRRAGKRWLRPRRQIHSSSQTRRLRSDTRD